MTFQEKEKKLLEEKIRLKQEKQMAEEKERRVEQLQKQVMLKNKLAMSKATLKAVTEEFEETSEPEKDNPDRLPEETQGVEKYLAEHATGHAHIATSQPILLPSVGVLQTTSQTTSLVGNIEISPNFYGSYSEKLAKKEIGWILPPD